MYMRRYVYVYEEGAGGDFASVALGEWPAYSTEGLFAAMRTHRYYSYRV